MLERWIQISEKRLKKTALNTSMFVSRHHVSMRVEKKLGTDEGVMLLVSKKSINKPHSLFKPQGSKLGKKSQLIVRKLRYTWVVRHSLIMCMGDSSYRE